MVRVRLVLVAAAAIRSGDPAYGTERQALEPSAQGTEAVSADFRVPPGSDNEAAVVKEFRAAQAEDTREALVRFIARHPDHSLADEARAQLDARSDLPGVPPGSRDPDADIYAGFDGARRQNTAQAYDAFIARFAPHPLALEAQKLRDRLVRGQR